MSKGDIMARGAQCGRHFEIREIEENRAMLFTWYDHGDSLGIFGWREEEASSYQAAHKMATAWVEKELFPTETRDLYNEERR